MKKKSSKKLHSEFAKNLQFFYQKPTKIFDIYNLQVHHIIPIDKNYDLKLDESNLIT